MLTGNGLKDPDSAIRLAGDTAEVVDGNLASVMEALGGRDEFFNHGSHTLRARTRDIGEPRSGI
ncbi:hypothetical protein GCM10025858_31240 [Alicyclobacillus sacchari]|nr:hypothetical protein GCM10025858_31240 [Alicyclobacillus sacchari]